MSHMTVVHNLRVISRLRQEDYKGVYRELHSSACTDSITQTTLYLLVTDFRAKNETYFIMRRRSCVGSLKLVQPLLTTPQTMAEAAIRHRPLNSETKGQLAVLFVNRGWERFPVNAKHNELALKEIIGKAEDGKHSRDQVKRYFTVWFKSGGVVAVPRIPLESLEKSLRERCGPAASLIALVKESYEFKACTQGSDQGLSLRFGHSRRRYI
jgi:hypothetical protein